MFNSPFLQFNGHLQTIIPSFFRKIPINYERERLELPDGDFIDVDWLKKPNENRPLLIISHGLEGNSTRHYVTGLAKLFYENGFDICAWNCRSCSGEMNRLPRFYHHGDAGDLSFLINKVVKDKNYQKIGLAGFSMGGSLSLRSVSEKPFEVLPEVFACAAVSVPLDLTTSVVELSKKGKRFYMNRFLRKLHVKLAIKNKMFPENKTLDVSEYKSKIKDFYDFDTTYTAPLHGYDSANQFYELASVKPLLKNIQIPTLIIQAENDPFLSQECLIINENELSPKIDFFVSKKGGHVGFQQRGKLFTFAEEMIYSFISNNLNT